MNAACAGNTLESMANENQIVALRARRINNYKMQLKSVLLEGYEIFGGDITDSIIEESRSIYKDWLSIKDNP